MSEDLGTLSTLCQGWNESRPRFRLEPVGDWRKTTTDMPDDVQTNVRAYLMTMLHTISNLITNKMRIQRTLTDMDMKRTK